MELESSLRRLGAVVSEIEKIAASSGSLQKGNQIDLFAGLAPKKPSVDNTLMAKTLDRTIARIENLLQVGGR